jgi:hypothetical protein
LFVTEFDAVRSISVVWVLVALAVVFLILQAWVVSFVPPGGCRTRRIELADTDPIVVTLVYSWCSVGICRKCSQRSFSSRPIVFPQFLVCNIYD